ncbi:unnamed protein product [Adineta ricciae]|uniref:Transmembrane protein 50A n=1 Tax=Adineta ricciae TaxID=249248 RepID=A0A815JQF1_ADIRI|nr:unnamed protein product [Adineta ricciae]
MSKLGVSKHANRNMIASILSGVLFAIGWWLVIDMSCQYSSSTHVNKLHYLIGIVATFALILANSIANSKVLGDIDGDRCLNQFGARSLLFISFLLAFGSLIASTWLLFGYYVFQKREPLYPGIVIFGQNVAIFISTMILKFGRTEPFPY